MLDPEKINSIRLYLKNFFKGYSIYDNQDKGRRAHSFRIEGRGNLRLLTVAGEFLDNLTVSEIQTYLQDFHLSELLDKNAESRLILTSDGLKVERI